MTAKIFALIVAIYGPTESFSFKPHLYAYFFTAEECRKAADHFEKQMQAVSHKGGVAICAERESASPLPTS